MNIWIKASPVRLIDEKGENRGVVETKEALRLAQEKGLDLIEIAPQADPPVCRIMEYGKFQYQKSRQARQQKTKQKKIEVKGIRLSLRTGQHDLETKAKQANKFINQGHKVRIEIILRGREKALASMAREKLNAFVGLITTETKVEQEIKRQPRGFGMVVAKE